MSRIVNTGLNSFRDFSVSALTDGPFWFCHWSYLWVMQSRMLSNSATRNGRREFLGTSEHVFHQHEYCSLFHSRFTRCHLVPRSEWRWVNLISLYFHVNRNIMVSWKIRFRFPTQISTKEERKVKRNEGRRYYPLFVGKISTHCCITWQRKGGFFSRLGVLGKRTRICWSAC